MFDEIADFIGFDEVYSVNREVALNQWVNVSVEESKC